MKQKFIAQAYSVRKEFEKDCENTIKTLKEIGFDAIQIDGMRGNTPREVAGILKKYGMKVVGMHIKHNRFFNDLDGIIEEAELFNCKDIFDKYIDDEDQNEEGYRKTKEQLIKVAQRLSPLGFRVGLHNPEYDFNNLIDGKRVMDYITEPVGGTLIYPEVDTYWTTVGEVDPLEYSKKFSGRMPIMHLKDIKTKYDLNNFKENITEIGSGDIDFYEILKWGEENGVEYYAIEQDYSSIGIFESMKQSYDYLVKLSEKIKKDQEEI